MHIGKTRTAEDEVHEIPPKAYEHKAISRSHPLPGTCEDIVAHSPWHDKTKRMVIPDALKVLRLQKGHKYCLLGRLSSEVGWNHYDTIRELEEKRKERAQVTYERKKQLTKLRVKAEKAAEEKLGPQSDILAVVKY
nr:60S ribosomal protein L13a-4-like [Quercus suber]